MKKYLYIVFTLMLLLQGCSLKTGYKQADDEKIYTGE